MDINGLLADAFSRIQESVTGAVSGLSVQQLSFRPDAESNSIAWLVWHLTRIQDDHVSGVAGTEQVWPQWAERFALPFDLRETGYGASSSDVAAVRASADLLLGYYDAVHEATMTFVSQLSSPDLDRVVDTRRDPTVTLGVRLVSVMSDDLQHAGQAEYVRGLIERRTA